MKIVIDGRLYSQSGVGRYTQKLIKNLAVLDKKNKYLIYLNKDNFFSFKPPAKNFEKRLIKGACLNLKKRKIKTSFSILKSLIKDVESFYSKEEKNWKPEYIKVLREMV